MALLDALLLDPYRTNIWIAVRTDGVAGTGTHSDPYDGSTAAKFDALMNALGVNNPNYNTPNYQPVCVHLGPGTFQTSGYADGVSGGWQAATAMKIVGSGIDVTILQLVNATTNAHYYAIGHAVSSGNNAVTVDFFEVTDLTVDCNMTNAGGAATACGAVRVLGNHSRVRHIKVINWGTTATSQPCFVISVITATSLIGVEDCGIDDCVAIEPAPLFVFTGASNVGPMIVFHAGAVQSTPANPPPANPLSCGIGPFIRNCFVDSGQTDVLSLDFYYEIRAVSIGWCKAGIIEGNQAHNVTYGVYQQNNSAQDIVIRNNWFKDVSKGVMLGNIDTETSPPSGTLVTITGSDERVTTTGAHNLVVGDQALLSTNGQHNGLVVTVTAVATSPQYTFDFNSSNPLPSTAPAETVSSVKKVFGLGNASALLSPPGLGTFLGPGGLIVEGNVIELSLDTVGGSVTPIGVHLNDFRASPPAAGSLQDSRFPAYVYSSVIIRDNKIRYLNGEPPAAGNFAGYGLQLNSAADLLVRNNVVESAPSPAIQNNRCGSVAYFNNQTPAGVLIQGVNGDNGLPYEELTTLADFALVLSMFNRRS